MKNRKIGVYNGNEKRIDLKIVDANDDIRNKIAIGLAITIATAMGFICGYNAANAVNKRVQDSILSYLNNESN